MSKHTPGPWCQDKWGSLMTEGGQDVLLRGITTISAGSDERIAEAEANTRLISAAPELLEALQVCIQQITALCSAEDVPDQARAAIAKATA
ncbi:TPA: hypothetical protein ACGJ1X_003916 [Pseudomonas aeruginosa]|uniref:hypothetical protein n=1 Tax=Pseudomonas aeruginosa TaxID=287 RepID=UPI00053EB68E|nr:hypothetical protein [Pseudomonas aeruginosa]